MKTTPRSSAANGMEAQGTQARPVSHGQRRLARQMADRIGGNRSRRNDTARLLRAALAAFGGQITRIELPAH